MITCSKTVLSDSLIVNDATETAIEGERGFGELERANDDGKESRGAKKQTKKNIVLEMQRRPGECRGNFFSSFPSRCFFPALCWYGETRYNPCLGVKGTGENEVISNRKKVYLVSGPMNRRTICKKTKPSYGQ